ncbi:MAG: hotdog fold thioesterase [Chryseobacterium sp.]|uniref:1,4-dihydroxy-2-naphthoyl-CoA hydrolase n=1 Tax=Epilithonimonas xixisoli TaxID=1476462 RepID=A0A4V3H316_9FLAO|nr:hotdog fold thioesterase [Epilithonimonas xixisoli]MBP6577593.1 hotdog fold thioesterase [Chryseobacterium sp.]MBP7499043.1 hotdog fold thioesterase [Chryseobacterium sp.]TDX87151.1 1,4-dihydroxy-2-naphthoyl-CoA hydrolase [Epilithonimonas xixisoli]
MEESKKIEILDRLNKASKNTLGETLDIIYTDVSDDFLTATMPVTPRVHQPYGIMHGGASCVLAETLGSCLSLINLDISKSVPVGTNINSNHLRAIREGIVTGTATFIRKGNTMHVSQIEIRDEKGNLINHTTMTNNIVPVGKV